MNASNLTPETPNNSPAFDEERLAKLMGFNEEPISQPSAVPLLSDEDLEDQKTQHSFASNPLAKLIAVGLGMLLLVAVAGLFFSQFQSSSQSLSANQPTAGKEEKQSPLLSAGEKDREKEKLLSEVALQEQKERLKDLQAEKAEKAPETPRANQPDKRTVALDQSQGKTPIPVQRSSPPLKRIPVRTASPASVASVVPPKLVRSTASERTSLPPAPRSVGQSPRVSRSQAASPKDPLQEWVQLGQVGSYSLSEVSKTSPGQERERPTYTPPPPSPEQSDESRSEPLTSPTQAPGSPVNQNGISLGQSVSAVLETPIAWEGSRGSRQGEPSEERYLIVLKEPLKDGFGRTQIPAGSQLLVRLASSNALVTLTAESVVLEGVESKLPRGSLTIRGAENQPLIAEMQEIGSDGGNNGEFLTDLLSVVGDFADIPGSRSLSTLNRLITGGGRTRQTGFTATIFFLPQGTPLEVFVNKAFSLNIPSAPLAPLELDLGAINSQQQEAEGGESSPEVISATVTAENSIPLE